MFEITRPPTEPNLKMLVYGPYGVGKTTLAATAQDVESMQDVLVLDAEAGSLSLSDREDIDVVRITNFRQFSQVNEFLRRHCLLRDKGDENKLAELHAKVAGKDSEVKEYRTVIIDSLTEVQKMVMYQLLGIDPTSSQLDAIPEQPQFREWGQSAEMIRLLVRNFRDLPMHVIFVCAEQEVQNDRGQLIRKPNLPGKLAGEVQGFLDVVGYYNMRPDLEGGGVRRTLHITPGTTFAAKNRFVNGKVDYLDEPEMSDVWELILKG